MKMEIRGDAEQSPGTKSHIGALPLPWKIVLSPTDLSDPSKCAITTAAALAQKCGAQLLLFHVVQCPNCSSFDAPPDAAKMMDQARECLEEITRTIPLDVAVRKIVRFGARDPAEEIVEEADHASADLIVIATHGYSGLKRALLGSTAEQVLRHAHCPVLVVRRSGNLPKEPENLFRT